MSSSSTLHYVLLYWGSMKQTFSSYSIKWVINIIFFYRSILEHDEFGHDVERTTVSLVRDGGHEDLCAIPVVSFEVTSQYHVITALAQVGHVSVQELAG